MLVSLAFAASVGLASPPGEAGAAWIRAHAVAVATPEAGSGFDDLAPLDAIIGDARIVALGEPTHGTREAFQLKHRLLEYLVERKGFSIFSIEASTPEAYALNDYVIDGKGDPARLIAGMYFWTWNTEEVLAMVEWMRDWNRRLPPDEGKPRLQFTGFDMQTPDVAFSIALSFARLQAPEVAERHAGLLADVKALASRAVGGGDHAWTTATGAFPAGVARGKKLRFSAWIRTEDVTGWAGAWWRCDTPAGVNGFNNMQDQGITGTTAWTRRQFTLDVPADTENINFGFILAGGGAAWFDGVEIELDGEPYDNPALFSLDFENPAVRFLSEGGPGYTVSRVEKNPHAGKKCLEIRRRTTPAAPRVDPLEVTTRAETFAGELAHRRDELAARTGPKATDWAIHNARIVAQCAGMHAVDHGFNARDEAMAANVSWILEQNPGQKIVLWAHNGHVSRAEAFGMTPMGRHLSDRFGKDMVVFGFAAGAGRYTAMAGDQGLRSDNSLAAPPEESVESIFLSSGLSAAIVDVRGAGPDDPGSAWAATRRPMRSIGALASDQQFWPCVPARFFDVLVWQSETTASRPLK